MDNYYKYWGKAKKKEEKEFSYHLLPYHCLDVAAVTWQLLDPEFQRCKGIAQKVAFPSKIVRYLITLIMIIHDLGKFSKTFQSLVPDLYKILFPLQKIKIYEERHDTLGFLLWRGDPNISENSIKHIFDSKSNILMQVADCIVKAGFGHHGIPPLESRRGGNASLYASSFFDDNDVKAAQSFVNSCFDLLGTIPEFSENFIIPKKILKELSWQIAGLGILADWIGSNIEYFPYLSDIVDLKDYWNNRALPQASTALDKIRWNEGKACTYSGISSIFPFIHRPTPLQSLAEITPLNTGPKLFIIEDVTGAGKTEAAIVLTARIMAAGEADGLYIGLPTMATANAMFDRMKQAYYKLYSDNSKPSIILSHGSSYLYDIFIKLLQKEDQSYGNVEGTASTYCNEWFTDNRKKALLADVGVGTIDQALIGILPVRHQSLRLLGLQRKVLVVDEVHAYDSYMSQLLETLLEAHSRGGGTAILLSATIPLKKKMDLLKAFRRGLGNQNDMTEYPDEKAFPSITQVVKDLLKIDSIQTRKEEKREVSVKFIYNYSDVLAEIIKKAVNGECLCWIRNTVKDARKAYFDLRNMPGFKHERIELFHSRFAMIDRARIEKATIDHFGIMSGKDKRKSRILIATQVVEQSLDLDFDAMFSDLAPIDLLIQRAGRLHRHVRDKKGNIKTDYRNVDERGVPILNIFCPEFDEEADCNWLTKDFKGTSAIYRHIGILWRTQKILEEKKNWKMPEDARKLIESVYGELAPELPPGLLQNAVKTEGEEKNMQAQGGLNALGLEKGYCWEADKLRDWGEEDEKSTRLSEENQEITLAVVRNGQLVPYADIEKNAWDWSTLSISRYHWKADGYLIPENFLKMIDELKKRNSRLKHCEIVIVHCQAGEALIRGKQISEFYDPRLGWGHKLDEEK